MICGVGILRLIRYGANIRCRFRLSRTPLLRCIILLGRIFFLRLWISIKFFSGRFTRALPRLLMLCLLLLMLMRLANLAQLLTICQNHQGHGVQAHTN